MFPLLITAAVGLRAIVSLHPYSGYKKPPMYGDFEAQRHWQEVTVNLPISDWYTNSSSNDLMYWGLDYPPLTAYHSWCMGVIAKVLNPAYIRLHSSRGITDDAHKAFMRSTVLVMDFCLYIPFMLLAVQAIYTYFARKRVIRSSPFLCMVVAVLYPGQILIDNGHFQYNNVSLGLAAIAVVAIFHDAHIWATVLFVLSLNYKQMELYHSLPFFFYLLAKCIRPSKEELAAQGTRAPRRYRNIAGAICSIATLAAVVAVTFAVIWSPWLRSMAHLRQVVHRIFPVARGVFEDKVANVWCVLNIFVKLK